MLVVETIAKIRRAYFVHGQPIKAICRDLGVSRKVVRKVIRSEAGLKSPDGLSGRPMHLPTLHSNGSPIWPLQCANFAILDLRPTAYGAKRSYEFLSASLRA